MTGAAAVIFDIFEHQVRRRTVRGQSESAAMWASLAARFAAGAHPGRFASLPIEQATATLGQAVPPIRQPRTLSRDGSSGEHVLHVLTRPETPGGHTNWLSRWIGADRGRVHNLVVIDPRGKQVPRHLASLVEESGGWCAELQVSPGKGVLARAAALRQLAADADTVLLATHPEDFTAALAFAGVADRPPVIRLNHADHLFWLGLCATDLLVEFRETGARWSREHRGYPLERQVVVPLPAPAPKSADRTAARRALSLADDAFVVLTIGSAHKYRPADGEGFVALMDESLRRLPGAVLVAVGPDPVGEWATAMSEFPGRVRPVGRQLDLAPYFGAADAYVNSFPIGSTLAMLEAAAASLPIVSISSGRPDRALLEGDDSCPPGSLSVHDGGALATALGALASDPSAAVELGARAGAHTREAHAGPGWEAEVGRSYELVRSVQPMTDAELHPTRPYDPSIDDTLARLGKVRSGFALLNAIDRSRDDFGPVSRLVAAPLSAAATAGRSVRTWRHGKPRKQDKRGGP